MGEATARLFRLTPRSGSPSAGCSRISASTLRLETVYQPSHIEPSSVLEEKGFASSSVNVRLATLRRHVRPYRDGNDADPLWFADEVDDQPASVALLNMANLKRNESLCAAVRRRRAAEAEARSETQEAMQTADRSEAKQFRNRNANPRVEHSFCRSHRSVLISDVYFDQAGTLAPKHTTSWCGSLCALPQWKLLDKKVDGS